VQRKYSEVTFFSSTGRRSAAGFYGFHIRVGVFWVVLFHTILLCFSVGRAFHSGRRRLIQFLFFTKAQYIGVCLC